MRKSIKSRRILGAVCVAAALAVLAGSAHADSGWNVYTSEFTYVGYAGIGDFPTVNYVPGTYTQSTTVRTRYNPDTGKRETHRHVQVEFVSLDGTITGVGVTNFSYQYLPGGNLVISNKIKIVFVEAGVGRVDSDGLHIKVVRNADGEEIVFFSRSEYY